MKELEHLHPFPHPHRSVWAVSVFISSAVMEGGGERGSQRDLVINSAARALRQSNQFWVGRRVRFQPVYRFSNQQRELFRFSFSVQLMMAMAAICRFVTNEIIVPLVLAVCAHRPVSVLHFLSYSVEGGNDPNFLCGSGLEYFLES